MCRWKVVAIPHFEWKSLPDRLSKLRYLRRKLLKAVAHISALEPARLDATSQPPPSLLAVLPPQDNRKAHQNGGMGAASLLRRSPQGLGKSVAEPVRGNEGLQQGGETEKQPSLTTKDSPVWDIFLGTEGKTAVLSDGLSDDQLRGAPSHE